MKKVLSAFMVLALALFGASRVAANEPHELPDAFLATLLQGKIGEAVDQYMATNPVLSEKKQQIQAVKSAIEGAFQIFGQPMGTEVVAVDDLAPSLRRFVFITKHASGPLTWEFYVYRARDSWIAVNLNFNDNFSLTAPRK